MGDDFISRAFPHRSTFLKRFSPLPISPCSISRRTKIFLALGLPALLAWFYTGGVAVQYAASYYPEGLVEVGGITFIFKVDVHAQSVGIPYFFMWASDSKPYDLSVQALAPNLALRNIHVRTVDAQKVGWSHAVTIAAGQAQSFQPKVLTDRLIDPITKIPSFSFSQND